MIRKKKQSFVRFKKVKCSALNVRSKPSIDSFDINLLVKDDVVECDKNFKDDNWDHITTEDGKEGFCMKKFLEPMEPELISAKSKHIDCDGQAEEVLNGKED